jgi:hypothetical protein
MLLRARARRVAAPELLIYYQQVTDQPVHI